MKQVVNEKPKFTLTLEEVSTEKIYAYKDYEDIYKLGFAGGSYRFNDLSNSVSGDFTEKTAIACIEAALKSFKTVYEFDTLKEFAEWLVKECKCHS